MVENGERRTSREEFPEGWKKWPVIGGQRYIWIHKYSRHHSCGVHYLRPVSGGLNTAVITVVGFTTCGQFQVVLAWELLYQ